MHILKQLILYSGAMLLGALSLNAQTTVVSSSGVVDSDSTTWANGTWSVRFRPNPNYPNTGQYNINGTPLSTSVMYQNGALNGSGTFSMTVYNNSLVSPGGSSWDLNVCPLASAPCTNFNFGTSSSTLDITTTLNSVLIAPRFNAISGTYGYVDAEAINTIPIGGTYYNVTNNCVRVHAISTGWTCIGIAAGAITGTLTAGLIPIATGANTVGNSLIDYGLTNAGDFSLNAPLYKPTFLAPVLGQDPASATLATLYGVFGNYSILGQTNTQSTILTCGASGCKVSFRTGNINFDSAWFDSNGLTMSQMNIPSPIDYAINWKPSSSGTPFPVPVGQTFGNGTAGAIVASECTDTSGNSQWSTQTSVHTCATDATPRARLDASGNFTAGTINARNGFNGTKVAGSCTLTIVNGIITNVTGC